MKRIVHLVFVAAVACGAGAAWSQESIEAPVTEAAAESAEAFRNVAAIGQSAERHAAPEAKAAPKVESHLEAMGLAGHGPFPSRGGPLD